MPALDLSLRHWMVGRTTHVFDVAVAQPLGQVAGDIARSVVREEPGPVGGLGLIKPTSLQRLLERGGDVSAFILAHSFQATI